MVVPSPSAELRLAGLILFDDLVAIFGPPKLGDLPDVPPLSSPESLCVVVGPGRFVPRQCDSAGRFALSPRAADRPRSQNTFEYPMRRRDRVSADSYAALAIIPYCAVTESLLYRMVNELRFPQQQNLPHSTGPPPNTVPDIIPTMADPCSPYKINLLYQIINENDKIPLYNESAITLPTRGLKEATTRAQYFVPTKDSLTKFKPFAQTSMHPLRASVPGAFCTSPVSPHTEGAALVATYSCLSLFCLCRPS